MTDFWNERYRQNDYAYGEAPNEYLKAKLTSIPAGTILFAAEGEGRNAVFAATLGWDVKAFDSSEEGQKKAFLLAQKNNVKFDYNVADWSLIDYKESTFDAVGLFYAHFSMHVRSSFHKKMASFLKPGGVLILEGFSTAHCQFQIKNTLAGGPKDPTMLFDIDELKKDFSNFKITEAYQTETILSEGLYHQGKASVIRFFITKNQTL